MSDFASLLGDLQKTAERAVAATKAPNQEENRKRSAGRKRQRPEDDNDETTRTSRRPALPRDAASLSIKVSFMCIGAQKAGTTWLHEMLQKCPGLVLPEQKELHFWDWHRRKGLKWYSRQFSQTQKDTIIMFGEITPCYMTLPDHDVQEIRALFPSVRIVFLARDLVERAWSALLMELRNAVRGMEAGQFAISDEMDERQLQKMDQESNPDLQSDEYFMDRLKHSTHTQRNDYAAGLRRWLRFFPKEQLLILDFNDIQQDPRRLLKRTLKHIGASTSCQSFVDSLGQDEMREKVNAAKGSTLNKEIRPSLRKQMEQHLRKPAKEMNALLQELGYSWRLNDYSS